MSNDQHVSGFGETANLLQANRHPVEKVDGGLGPWNQIGIHVTRFFVNAFRKPLCLLLACQSLKGTLASLSEMIWLTQVWNA